MTLDEATTSLRRGVDLAHAGRGCDALIQGEMGIGNTASSALQMHRLAPAPLAVLTEFGGLEIAMMVGAALGAAASRRVVVADGFLSSAAVRIAPELLPYCVFAHGSAEPGHAGLLAPLGAEPLLQLGLRLGEGTGGVLGGGGTREARLAIMKDSRSGPMGAWRSASSPRWRA